MNPLPVPGPAPAKGVDVNLTAHKDSLQADTTRIAALPGKPGTLVKKEAKKLSPDGKTTPQEGQTEIQGLLHLGEVLGDRGEYDTAEIAYWQILNRPQLTVPDEKSALLGLAHMLRKKGDPPALTKAAAIYEKYVKEFSDDEQVPRALLELGRTLRDMGVYKVAINRFYSVINSTLKFSPQDFAQYEMLAKTAQFEIAQTYFDAGDFVEAGKFFGRVRLLDLAPQDQARAQFMAAESEQLAGHLDAAVMLLKTYLSTAPDDANVPEARYLLATTLRQLKRHQEALEVTLELLRAEHSKNEADPKSWLNWQRRAGNQIANDLFQDGDSRNALAIYKGLLELASDPAWRLSVTYQIALCCERLFQVEDARQAYQAIIAAGQVKAGAPAPTPEAKEMASMATWRLAHMQWQDKVEGEFNTFFSNGEKGAPANSAQPAQPAAAGGAAQRPAPIDAHKPS
jgi:tetratricopeptide (TPR) repeat protein